MSETAHLVQMFYSTVVRAHVSAAGAKGGKTSRRSAARVAVCLPRYANQPCETLELVEQGHHHGCVRKLHRQTERYEKADRGKCRNGEKVRIFA